MAEDQASLDNILETCLHAIETQGWTVDDCLSHYAAYRHDLEPLLKIAEQFHLAQMPLPSSAFQEQALSRLQTRLKQSHRPGSNPSVRQRVPPRAQARPQPFYAQRRFAFGLIALIIILGLSGITTGTIYAAGSALPGDPLYPVEQTIEQVRLSIASPEEAIGLRMDFAEKRLNEAEQLRKKGDDRHIQVAVDGYDQLVSDVTRGVGSGSNANDPALLGMLSIRLARQQDRLQALLNAAPPAAQAGIATAIEASKRGQEKAAQAINDHGGKPLSMPTEDESGNGSGGSPNVTPTGGDENPPAGTGNGNGNAICSDGTSLDGGIIGQAHKLANKYNVSFSSVQDLFCAGLTADQVEAQLSSDTPSATTDKGNNAGGNGNGNGNGKGGGNDNGGGNGSGKGKP